MSEQTSRTRLFHVVSAIAMFVFCLYSFVHLFYFQDINFFYKALGFLFCFTLSMCMPSMRYIVSFTPHMSYLALKITGILSAFFMALVTTLMVIDFWLFIINPLFLSKKYDFYLALFFSGYANLYIFLIAIGITIYGCFSALRCPRTHKLTLPVKNLPKELEGLRIVQISDLHIGSTFDGTWLSKLVENTNELNPDLILITGDLVDGSVEKLSPDLIKLKDLKAKHGVYICLGNHEFYCGANSWILKWREWGLNVLINQNIRLEHNAFTFVLSAVADREGRKFKGMLRPDMSEALKDVTEQDFIIFMEHQPKNAHKNAKRGVNVQLSGHTHGGQYFLLFPLIKMLNGGYRTGLYFVKDMSLYVSSGTGLWGYAPLRVGSQNEIAELTLTHK